MELLQPAFVWGCRRPLRAPAPSSVGRSDAAGVRLADDFALLIIHDAAHAQHSASCNARQHGAFADVRQGDGASAELGLPPGHGMLEGAVAAVLQKALGAYLEGIDSASLRASVWDGDIVLREVSLRTSALEALQLPVRVLGGSVGVVRVQVPWRKLRTDPIVINIEGLWLLLAPQDSTEQWDEEGERLRKLAAMKQRLEVWEEVEAKKGTNAMGAGMLEQLTTALLRRLRIQVLLE